MEQWLVFEGQGVGQAFDLGGSEAGHLAWFDPGHLHAATRVALEQAALDRGLEDLMEELVALPDPCGTYALGVHDGDPSADREPVDRIECAHSEGRPDPGGQKFLVAN